MNPTALPAHWSPEQALAVYELLQQLSEQLWRQYQRDFVDLLGEQAAEVLQPTPCRSAVDLYQLDLPYDRLDDLDDGGDLPF